MKSNINFIVKFGFIPPKCDILSFKQITCPVSPLIKTLSVVIGFLSFLVNYLLQKPISIFPYLLFFILNINS